MIALPLSLLVIPFALGLVFWVVFSLFAIMHVVRYGFINYGSYLMTCIFLGASIITLFVGYSLLLEIDLSTPFITL
ncbi:hypothetical protein IT409_02275 [Candidatus Falkowbacteria bacterium]|nr:hypothetical protein [Candidatus Falkowbacteria bacterium]